MTNANDGRAIAVVAPLFVAVTAAACAALWWARTSGETSPRAERAVDEVAALDPTTSAVSAESETLDLDALTVERAALERCIEIRSTLVLDAMLERGEGEEVVEPSSLPPAPTGVVERWRCTTSTHAGIHTCHRARLVTAEHPATREIDAELRRVERLISEHAAQHARR